MTQDVRTEVAADARALAVDLQRLPEAESRQALPFAAAQKQPWRLAPFRQRRAAVGEIALHPSNGFVADRHDALLAALPRACEVALVEAHVRQTKSEQLRHPQTGCIQHFDERSIPKTARGGGVRRREE